MTEKIVNIFNNLGKWWYWIITFVLFIGIQRLILTYVDQLEELTSGLPMIELPTLVNRSLYAIASQYPQEALRLYQRTLQPLDILLPLLAGLWFTVSLAMLTKVIFSHSSRWQYLPLFGLAATLLDWTENLGVFFILRTRNTPIPWLDVFTRGLTLVKTGVGIICLGLMIGLSVTYLYRYVKLRR